MFKPKKLTKTQVENRKLCGCSCHWSASSGGWGDKAKGYGITDEEALELAKEKKG